MSRRRSAESPVVVVTGASSGVGRATAVEFGRRKASVGLLARNPEGLEAARKEVEREGGRGLVLPVDVTEAEQVRAAAGAVEEAFGPIDVWVNSAMVSFFAPVDEIEPEEFRRVTDVTYHGTVYGTMAALERMRRHDRGVIVQVGSALAHRAIPYQPAYCGAKHAMQGFTESLRCELLHQKSRVRVTMVHLPAVNTPHFDVVSTRLPRHPQPVPPIFEPEVAARSIVWTADHPRRRETWVGGRAAAGMIAHKLAPGVLDRFLAATAYEGQQTGQPVDPGRPSNLWHTVPGDRGTRGSFGDQAHEDSLQLRASMNRDKLTPLAGGAAVLAVLAARRAIGIVRRDRT